MRRSVRRTASLRQRSRRASPDGHCREWGVAARHHDPAHHRCPEAVVAAVDDVGPRESCGAEAALRAPTRRRSPAWPDRECRDNEPRADPEQDAPHDAIAMFEIAVLGGPPAIQHPSHFPAHHPPTLSKASKASSTGRKSRAGEGSRQVEELREEASTSGAALWRDRLQEAERGEPDAEEERAREVYGSSESDQRG